MKWQTGRPFEDGNYLCAVRGFSTPYIFYYNLEQDVWYNDRDETFDSDDISYYTSLEDIPMPENW
jgi:hypothetical protein